jgi:AbrB family looped-hinge helix DNA binding protein
MKTTVTVTSRGVVTLPLGLRKALGIKPEDTLIAETTPDGLLLRPAVTLPVEIYTPQRIREFDDAEEELAKALGQPSAATKPPRRTRRA